MFTITSRQDQYLIYDLQDTDARTGIAVIPERGGIVTQWWQGSHQWLYLDQERLQNPQLSVRGGIPILFPICGNLPGNTYLVDGQSYQLSQHGFARSLPWTVVAQDTETEASLTLELTDTAATREVYPFSFAVRFRYSLRGQTLTLEQTYENRGSRSMPFATGIHPYFTVGEKTALTWQIPSSATLSKDGLTSLPFANQFDFEQPELDLLFPHLNDQRASVVGAESRLTLHWDPEFRCLVFWTLQDQPFYCLEPWSSPRNAMNTGENLLMLAPGESMVLRLAFTGELMG